jgi:hypothetical protein
MNEQRDRSGSWRRMRVFLALAGIAFAMTLALVVGNRLSDEALGVLAGAVCGVGAAIPTSLLIVAVTRRQNQGQTRTSQPEREYPPVVVVAPPGSQQRPNSWGALPSSFSPPTQRQFTVVGEPPMDGEVTIYEHRS